MSKGNEDLIRAALMSIQQDCDNNNDNPVVAERSFERIEEAAALALSLLERRREIDPDLDQRVNELREWLGGAKA